MKSSDRKPPRWIGTSWAGIVAGAAALGGLTALLAPLANDDEIASVAVLVLLVVLVVAAFWGYRAGLVSAVLGAALLNFFFIPPLHRFTVGDPHNVVTLFVLLAVAVIGAWMLARFREQLEVSARSRAQLQVLLDTSEKLAAATSATRALDALAASVQRALAVHTCAILVREEGAWRVATTTGGPSELTREESGLAAEASERGTLTRRRPASGSSRALPDELYVPISPGPGDAGIIRLAGYQASEGRDLLLAAFVEETRTVLGRLKLEAAARRGEASQRSDELKTAILSSVSHDLRSPLTAIKAAVSGLRLPGVAWSPEDAAQLLETIETQTDRLTGTVTDLLDLSRIEGGALRPALEPLEARALLEDVKLATAAAAKERRVCIEVIAPVWLRGDHSLLLQALTNLVENAARYSMTGGPIHLSATAAAGQAIVQVADAGPGIDEADLPHIFEKFYRGKTADRPTGTGLGLAITRALVELCGGRIEVDSSPAGTTFRLKLPSASPPS